VVELGVAVKLVIGLVVEDIVNEFDMQTVALCAVEHMLFGATVTVTK
jgi:hypothetical protein